MQARIQPGPLDGVEVGRAGVDPKAQVGGQAAPGPGTALALGNANGPGGWARAVRWWGYWGCCWSSKGW